jgi:serine/threonine-protein kinase
MIGRTVSHYRILEKIGSGGMGEIYLAEDTKLERQVALKFLPRHLIADMEARERFKREAQAAAALNHPNIVTVYEIGEHEGQVFIAMEYAAGQTLKELISEGADPRVCHDIDGNQKKGEHKGSPLPITQVIDIAAQIAAGLAAAHAKNIVHRDIKPQNILIDKDGRIKILDFGLAKLKGASPLTQESFTMGTVHYMSPEQGLGKEVDPRSDIWSLGIVLYQLVSGKLPFRGEYDQAVIYAILNEETPPLGIKATPAGAGLEKVIRRCLAKKRHERYPSAEALATALRGLDNAKETTRPETGTRRKFSRRALLTAIPLLLLTGILGFITLNPRAFVTMKRFLGMGTIPHDRHLAVLPLHSSAGGDAALMADGFTAVITDKLTWMEQFHDSLWTVPLAEVLKHREKSAFAMQRLWGCRLFVSGELYARGNSLRLRLKLDDARTGREMKRVELQGHIGNLSLFQDGLLAKLKELLELPVDPRAVKTVNVGGTAMPGAFVLFLKGMGMAQFQSGMEPLDMAITLLEKALKQDPSYVQARLSLTDALRFKYKRNRDPLVMQQALEHGRQASQEAGPWAPAHLACGLLAVEGNEKAKAQEEFQETLRLNERCYMACIELAKLNTTLGRINKAEGLYKRAIAIRTGYPRALAYLGFFYKQNGRIDEALSLYRQATALAPGDFNAFNNMGNIYMLQNDKAEAISTFERSIAIQPNAVAQSNLATLFFYQGNYRKALPLFKEVADNGADCRLWGNLADTYRQLPEYMDKAIAAYRKAIGMAMDELKKNPDNIDLLSVLALYHAHSGEKAQALKAIGRARELAPADLEIIRRAILTYEAAGERSQALEALRDFHERLGSSAEIEKEPDLAEMRRDPLYMEIIADRK